MKFSVLLSVYAKEKPNYLNECLKSLVTQTLLPSEIVIMKDGMLTEELENVLDEYNRNYPELFKFYGSKEHRGLGTVLNEGILKCSYDYIARMDADDICLPNRFEKQIKFLEANPNIDILGGQIIEFDNDTNINVSIRKVPTTKEEIRVFLKRRCPFSQQTVIFKKDSILKAGNYDPGLNNKEDYLLWGKLVYCNMNMANLDDILVKVRVCKEMYQRRGGIQYIYFDLIVQKKFLQMKLINFYEYITNCLMRIGGAILPASIRKIIHRKFLRKKVTSNKVISVVGKADVLIKKID